MSTFRRSLLYKLSPTSIIRGSGTESDPFVYTGSEYDTTNLPPNSTVVFENVVGTPQVSVDENGQVTSYTLTTVSRENSIKVNEPISTNYLPLSDISKDWTMKFTILIRPSDQTYELSTYTGFVPSKPSGGWVNLMNAFYRHNVDRTVMSEGFAINLSNHSTGGYQAGHITITKSLSTGKQQFTPTTYSTSTSGILTYSLSSRLNIEVTKQGSTISFSIVNSTNSKSVSSNMTITPDMISDEIDIKVGGIRKYNSDELFAKALMTIEEFSITTL